MFDSSLTRCCHIFTFNAKTQIFIFINFETSHKFSNSWSDFFDARARPIISGQQLCTSKTRYKLSCLIYCPHVIRRLTLRTNLSWIILKLWMQNVFYISKIYFKWICIPIWNVILAHHFLHALLLTNMLNCYITFHFYRWLLFDLSNISMFVIKAFLCNNPCNFLVIFQPP